MPKLSELLAEKANADIQVGAATVKVQFYVLWREHFSDEEWTDLMKPGVTASDQFKRLLPRVLLSWDIVDDDGHDIPVTADAIDQHQIPVALLSAVWFRLTGSDLAGKVISSNSHVP